MVADFITDEGLEAEAQVICLRFIDLTSVQRLRVPREVHHGEGFLAIKGAYEKAKATARLTALCVPNFNHHNFEEALDLMRERAMSVLNHPGEEYIVRWSKRPTTSRLGVFKPCGDSKTDKPIVEVSSALKNPTGHADAHTILAHEVAHLIANAIGRTLGGGHGPVWGAVAEVCGGRDAATRCITLKPAVSALVDNHRKPRKTFPFECKRCGEVSQFSARQRREARRIEEEIEEALNSGGIHEDSADNYGYRHRRCGGKYIEVTEEMNMRKSMEGEGNDDK